MLVEGESSKVVATGVLVKSPSPIVEACEGYICDSCPRHATRCAFTLLACIMYAMARPTLLAWCPPRALAKLIIIIRTICI